MSGTSAWLADRVASLLPKTTAGACVPYSAWSQYRTTCNQFGGCCDSSRTCHTSCHGGVVCGTWRKYFCW